MDKNLQGNKELSCKDFRLDCDYTVRAETEDEVLKQCQAHACSAHGKCATSPQTEAKIKSHIREI